MLEVALKVPDTGPIGVEGDRGQMEYRRIRIRRLRASASPNQGVMTRLRGVASGVKKPARRS